MSNYDREQWFHQELKAYARQEFEEQQTNQLRWQEEAAVYWQDLQAESRVARTYEVHAQQVLDQVYKATTRSEE